MQEQFTEYQPMKACPICARLFDGSVDVCDVDGYELVQAEDDPLIGTWLLDRYVILSVLGAGGWGRVYKARHLTLGTVVAIKTLYLHLASNKEKVSRFEQEARAACALRHENIAAVYDFGTMPNGQPFIVMDFLGGENLHTLLQNDRVIEPHRAINIFKQICAGLAAAHDRGIVHRDIKPGNIVLLPDPDRGELVKLFDFGLAKLHMEDGTSLNQLTQTGETVGTPAYMSPEQCQGWKLDRRTDLYSLGCVMYECLTGVQAFTGPTTYECMSKHVNDGAAPFSEVTQGRRIPVALEEIVFKALQKDPKKRYQSAREMLSDLAKYEEIPTPSAMGSITRQGVALKRPWRNAQRIFKIHKRAVLMGITTLTLVSASCLLVYQSWRGVDPSQMSPNDRWFYFTQLGTQSLMNGNYTGAEADLKKALVVAETFTTADKRKVTLANQALLYHMMLLPDKEKDADKQLDLLIGHPPQLDLEKSQFSSEEMQFLSQMLDKASHTRPVDGKQLRSIAQRINSLFATSTQASAEERQLEEKAADTLKQNLGASDETYGLMLERLGWGYYQAGDHQKALALFLQCLPLRQAAVPRTDPEYFRLLLVIGTECARTNKLDDAEKYLEEAVAVRDSAPSPNDKADAISQLAMVYNRLGNYKQEYDTWKQASDLWDHEGNYETADFPFIELVYAGNRLGINSETENYLINKRALLISHYGQGSSGVAAYCLALAELYLMENRLDKAEASAKQALEIRQLTELPGYLPVRRAMETLARVYMAEHRYVPARNVYDVYLACAERNVQADNNKGLLLDALSKTAYMNMRLSDLKKASDYMMRFHVLLSGIKPAATGYDVTRAVDPVFTALKGLGLKSQDYLQLEQLLNYQTTSCDRNGAVIDEPNAQTQDSLSRVYCLAGRFKDAQDAEQKAISLLNKRVPAPAWTQGRVYSQYAAVLQALGKTKEATDAATEASKFPLEVI